jgi:uncharacterized membrane protein (UPF0127 family)
MKLKVGERVLDIEIPKDPYKGLKGRKSIDPDKGMIFDFTDRGNKAHITMQDMKMPIDLLFVNGGIITNIIKARRGREYKGTAEQVIEVQKGSGFNKGDQVTKAQNGGLLILDQKGNVQKEIGDGSRIFSRIHTNQLVDTARSIAKKRSGGSINKGYEELANLFFKFIDIQDKLKPEYV